MNIVLLVPLITSLNVFQIKHILCEMLLSIGLHYLKIQTKN